MMDALNAHKNFLAMRMFAEVSGMNAENMQRQCNGESMAYTDEDYWKVINEYDHSLQIYTDGIADLSKKRS